MSLKRPSVRECVAIRRGGDARRYDHRWIQSIIQCEESRLVHRLLRLDHGGRSVESGRIG